MKNKFMDCAPLYLPHEGLHAAWNLDETELILTLPWVTIELEIDPHEKSWIKEALNHLYQSPTHPSVQRFLTSLEAYSIAYYGPRQLWSDQIPLQVGEDPILDEALNSPFRFVYQIAPNLATDLQSSLPEIWDWDIDNLLNKSHIPETSFYDSLSIGSLLIGKQLDVDAQTKQHRIDFPRLLDVLRKQNEDQFFNLCRTLLRQTHYITSRFQD